MGGKTQPAPPCSRYVRVPHATGGQWTAVARTRAISRELVGLSFQGPRGWLPNGPERLVIPEGTVKQKIRFAVPYRLPVSLASFPFAVKASGGRFWLGCRSRRFRSCRSPVRLFRRWVPVLPCRRGRSASARGRVYGLPGRDRQVLFKKLIKPVVFSDFLRRSRPLRSVLAAHEGAAAGSDDLSKRVSETATAPAVAGAADRDQRTCVQPRRSARGQLRLPGHCSAYQRPSRSRTSVSSASFVRRTRKPTSRRPRASVR